MGQIRMQRLWIGLPSAWAVLCALVFAVAFLAGCGSSPGPTPTVSAATAIPSPTRVREVATPGPTATDLPAVATSTPLPHLEEALSDAPVVWRPAPSVTDSPWQVFLTGRDVTSLAVEDSVLWAASKGGLLRWDTAGRELTQYAYPAIPLPGNVLSHVLLDGDTLYVSGPGGVSRRDGQGRWARFTREEIGLEIGAFAPMALVDRVLWVAGVNGFARLHPDGRWDTVPVDKDTVPTPYVERLVAEGDALYVVVALSPTDQAERQVARYVDGGWQVVERPDLVYVTTADGSRWRGARGILWRSQDDGTTWEPLFAAQWAVRPVGVDGLGRLVVSADDALYVIQDGQVVDGFRFGQIGPQVTLPTRLTVGPMGALWVGTEGWGVSRFDGQGWRNWRPPDAGLEEGYVRGLAVDAAAVYAAVGEDPEGGGVAILDRASGAWHHVWPEDSPLSGGGVGQPAVGSNGLVYLPNVNGRVDVYDPARDAWSHLPPLGIPPRYRLRVLDSLVDRQGDLWLATDNLGLWRWDATEQVWRTYGIPGLLTGLALDGEGRLWVSGQVGLVVRDPDTGLWHLYDQDNLDLTGHPLLDVVVDGAGRVWTVSAIALTVFDGVDRVVYGPEVVGSDLWRGALTVDGEGRLWAAMGNGVVRYVGEPELGPFQGLQRAPTESLPEDEMFVTVE